MDMLSVQSWELGVNVPHQNILEHTFTTFTFHFRHLPSLNRVHKSAVVAKPATAANSQYSAVRGQLQICVGEDAAIAAAAAASHHPLATNIILYYSVS